MKATNKQSKSELREQAAYAVASDWLEFADKTLKEGGKPGRLSLVASAHARDYVESMTHWPSKRWSPADFAAIGQAAVEYAKSQLVAGRYPGVRAHFAKAQN